METIISSLQSRHYIDALTHSNLDNIIAHMGKVKVYCGFDPTAESLHLGNLVAIMGLAWFRKMGHDVIFLIGGATGMIGDPSGRSAERSFLDEEILNKNIQKITEQVRAILERIPGSGTIEIVDNKNWYQSMPCLSFLRDIGKYFRVGQMLAKESVKTRLQSEEGLSFTEFTYQTLQAHDFYHLFTQHGTVIQIGGSDQWGNITAGTEYIRKLLGKDAYGITFPLLVKSDGNKFGKSEKGAIWLSKELLSEYDFYQYLVRTEDKDVITLLQALTFLPIEHIDHIRSMMSYSSYIPNTAQKILAEEVTRLIHGQAGLEKALHATSLIMPGHSRTYTKETIVAMTQELCPIVVNSENIIGKKIVDAVMCTGLIASKSEIKRLIKNGGISLNGEKITSEDEYILQHDCIGDEFLVFAVGKKQKAIIKIV